MTEPLLPTADGSRRIYILWAVGLALLVALALVGFLIVRPALETRSIVQLVADKKITEEEAIARLGGPEEAAHRLLFNLRHFDWFRWRNDLGTFAEWSRHAKLLGYCEVPSSVLLFKDRELSDLLNTMALYGEDEKTNKSKARAENYRRWAGLLAP